MEWYTTDDGKYRIESLSATTFHGALKEATSDASEKQFFEVFAAERCTQSNSRAFMEFIGIQAILHFHIRFNVDCSLEIMFLATCRHHRSHKLGTILCKISIDLAKKLKDGPVSTITVSDFGPKYAFMLDRKAVSKVQKLCQALWTATASQKIGKNLGFTVYVRVPFTEFKFNGKTFSERIGSDPWWEGVAIRI